MWPRTANCNFPLVFPFIQKEEVNQKHRGHLSRPKIRSVNWKKKKLSDGAKMRRASYLEKIGEEKKRKRRVF